MCIENPKWFIKKQGHMIQGQYTKHKTLSAYWPWPNWKWKTKKPLAIAFKIIKLLGKNLTKYVKYLHTEDHKVLK